MNTMLIQFGFMVLTAFVFTLDVFAGNVSWLGGNGVWSDPAKWSGAALPATGDDAYVTNAVAGETQILYEAPTVERLENLYLDSSGSGTLVVTQAQDRLEVQHHIRLGTTSGSTVKYLQTGGTNIFSVGFQGVFAVGFQTGSTGVYHLVDGALAANGDYGGYRSNVQLGPGGHGTFIQDGGILQGSPDFTKIAHDNKHLVLGGRDGYNFGLPGGTGHYVLSGGAVCFSWLQMGTIAQGIGVFHQTGGSNHISTAALGVKGLGHYRFEGGEIFNFSADLGYDGGTGIWTHANGSVIGVKSGQGVVRIFAGRGGTNAAGVVGTGIFNMQGGVFYPYYAEMQIGIAGRGILNVTGGLLDRTFCSDIEKYVLMVGVTNGGHGTVNVTGGTLRTRSMSLGHSGLSTGAVNLTGGTLEIGSYGSGSLVIGRGDGSTGTFRLGDAGSTGAIHNWGTKGNHLTIRQEAGAAGEFRGWGDVQLDDNLVNNGVVTADGYGVDRALDLSRFTTFSNRIENAAHESHGWYAVNGGRLVLPSLAVPTGSSTRNWGESADDATPDLVNSLRFAFTGVTTGGSLTASLMATDRTDIPAVPKQVLSVWRIDAPASMAFAALEVTPRYDHGQADSLGLAGINVYRWNGSAWKALPSTDDPVAKTVTASLDSLAGAVFLAVGNIPPTATTIIVR